MIKHKRLTALLIALLIAAPIITLATGTNAAQPDNCDAAPYTDDDAAIIARLLWGECRGVESKTERAACAWVVLNRVDADGYSDSISAVVTARKQFTGYVASHPVDDELLDLAYDVLNRWALERIGKTDVGRVIPADYCFFSGRGGRNWFRQEYKSKEYWDWSLESPYED